PPLSPRRPPWRRRPPAPQRCRSRPLLPPAARRRRLVHSRCSHRRRRAVHYSRPHRSRVRARGGAGGAGGAVDGEARRTAAVSPASRPLPPLPPSAARRPLQPPPQLLSPSGRRSERRRQRGRSGRRGRWRGEAHGGGVPGDVAVEEPPVERALAGRGRVGVGVGEVAPAEPRAGAAGVRAAAFGDVDDGGSEAVAALRRRGVAEAGAASERAVVVVAARRPSAGAGLHGGETRRRGLVGEAGEQREEVGAERGAVAASGRRHRCRGAVDLREVAGRVELSTAGYNGARAADDDEE
ncbi:Os01g0775750, partial [Oryza sativa Japonica Group]